MTAVSTYDASGSTQETTGTISASSTALTLAAAQDFADGEGILVWHVGAANTLTTPSAPGVVKVGVGTSSYTYKICALQAGGGITAPSTGTTVTQAPDVLGFDVDALLSVTWSSVTNAVAYAVYRDDVLRMITDDLFWNDNGEPAVDSFYVPSAIPTVALPDHLLSEISSGGGTTSITLADQATAAGTAVRVIHDDSVAVQDTIDNATDGIVEFGVGTYLLSEHPAIDESTGLTIKGAGRTLSILRENSIEQVPDERFGILNIIDSDGIKLVDLGFRGDKGTFSEERKGLFVRNSEVTIRDCEAQWVAGEVFYFDGDFEIFMDNCVTRDCYGNAFNPNASNTTGDLTMIGCRGYDNTLAVQLLTARRIAAVANLVEMTNETGGTPVLIAGVPNLTYVGNHVINCNTRAATVNTVELGNVAGQTEVGGVFANNLIQGNTVLSAGVPLKLTDAIGPLLIEGNMIYNNGATGFESTSIKVTGTNTADIVIRNNYVDSGTFTMAGVTIEKDTVPEDAVKASDNSYRNLNGFTGVVYE